MKYLLLFTAFISIASAATIKTPPDVNIDELIKTLNELLRKSEDYHMQDKRQFAGLRPNMDNYEPDKDNFICNFLICDYL